MMRIRIVGCFICLGLSLAFHVSPQIQLARMKENRNLTGFLLRAGSSLSDPWLTLKKYGLGATSDANLHHFVTYFSIGFK